MNATWEDVRRTLLLSTVLGSRELKHYFAESGEVGMKLSRSFARTLGPTRECGRDNLESAFL